MQPRLSYGEAVLFSDAFISLLQQERIMTTRFAGYIRVSKEEPTGGFSLDAQERAIRAWVKARGGELVRLYADESQSGRTADRPAFQQMYRDAARQQFDALVVNKFDRLHRNRKDSLAFKSLLRYDYGIGVYSVTEPS
jgi:site-specific DNA recombinase